MTQTILDKALAAASEGFPVFPTDNKRPCWTNEELGVAQGEGGHKVATYDPEDIATLFSHERAKEVSVPMGEPSGLICVDIDVYKDPSMMDWIERQEWLRGARCHRTRSGGFHFFFQYQPEQVLPSILRPFVDIKKNGGFVCWIGTDGYELLDEGVIAPLPDAVVEEYADNIIQHGNFNAASDEELIEAIKTAEELYPALRTLSFRMVIRVRADGSHYSREEMLLILRNLMEDSDAKSSNHPRHYDWADRLNHIERLVDSAIGKIEREKAQETSNYAALAALPPLIEVDVNHANYAMSDSLVPKSAPASFTAMSANSLQDEHLPPLEWFVPNFIPKGSVVGVAGASNVGKTRFLALLAMACSCGKSEEIGLPEMEEPISVAWVANEEHTVDIKRRLKAASLFYKMKQAYGDIFVHGKDKGRIRLVVADDKTNKPKANMPVIKELIASIKASGVSLLMLDPYITLAGGVDENSNAAADAISEVFNLIIKETGCSILHTHHCPKENTKSDDWYAGTSSAWRGAGAIFSALDCGFTLSPYTANSKNKKGAQQVGNWITLDSAKIREGEKLRRTFYELVPQEMYAGEGMPIGVCRIGSEIEAKEAVSKGQVEILRRVELLKDIAAKLGEGEHDNMMEVHRIMQSSPYWISGASKTVPFHLIVKELGEMPHLVGEYRVVAVPKGKGGSRSMIKIEKR